MTTEEYRIGIEEEYFIVDGETRSALRRMPGAFMDKVHAELGGAVSGELLQSQIEVMTRPHESAAEARRQLRGLRRSLGEVAAGFDLAFLASGTHPTASWQTGKGTQTRRYDGLMHDLQMLGERNMLCGMHVHVELPDADQRIDVMRRILPYLPIFVALSTSSPFWESKRTGLMGYRLAAYDELPRTGLPELFETAKDYQDYIDALVAARAIRDSSYVWWTIRPSVKHPTLELRAPDSCTRVEDSVAIAALYRALVRHLVRNPGLNAGIDAVDRAIASENKWRAQRYGIHGSFVDRGAREAVPVAQAVETLIDQLRDDAQALGGGEELEHLRTILGGGTSADVQIAVYQEAAHRTGNRNEALNAVKTWLAHASAQ
ncbi:Putative glutamate--cysteine ligase 2 [Starkeya nomas]|uniref:Putative glutamate--cysteine ligase 2 n=2 Tax=Xanthobacteraceae TaxID=335928 RepID=A0A5S9NBS5_9HYPH|nr:MULTISPECIES: carboxylate-amine ligase [Xanthobacteraceae]TSJ60949.1 carboxylate-amine ligase [Ancylobacter moscoviensis]CAA0086765.1 Putative glutamate--cysteine ligase 2 [Starkeya nomas]